MNKNDKPKVNPFVKIAGEYTSNELSIVLTSVFLISIIYYYLFANYIFFYQENQFLFIFSCDYLHQFAIRPGGLLEYTGYFFSQGYFNYFYASFILSAFFVLIAFVYLKINKRLSPHGTYSVVLIIIPPSLLILLQSNINWLLHHNIGILLTVLYFWLSIASGRKLTRIITIAFFPLFYYYACGYAWIYFLMFTFYSILYDRWKYPLILLVTAIISFILFKEVLFLQPFDFLIFYHLPVPDYFRNPVVLYLSAIIIIIYPVFIKVIYSIKQTTFTRFVSKYASLPVLLVTIFVLSKIYSFPTVNLFKLEKFIIRQDWNKVIEYQEAVRSNNIIAQYYYNLALAEKGILCDRMFFAPQDYGPNSILIPWNDKEVLNNLFRGIYFYYAIGLVNEAHRWAFESMVVQGYRPENIKMLIKTELITGNYKIAEKYINVLKKTLHYRRQAQKYESMIHNPELIKSDPELGEKIKLLPKEDFPIRIKNPQTNVLLLLNTNPGNRKAFEYKIAWYLLEKNIVGVVTEMKKIREMGYASIPRHMEEAALAYSVNMGPLPVLEGFNISKETEKRFNDYESALAFFHSNKSAGSRVLQITGRNTYWLYLDFK